MNKLPKIIELVLLVLSVVVIVAFFVMPHAVATDAAIEMYLYWAYFLVALSVLVLLGFLLAKTFSSKKGIFRLLALLAGVVVLVGVSFLLSKGGDIPTSVAYTEQTSKFCDTALHMLYIMLGASVVALFGTAIFNAIRNR